MEHKLLTQLVTAFNGYNNVKEFTLPPSDNVNFDEVCNIFVSLYRELSDATYRLHYLYNDPSQLSSLFYWIPTDDGTTADRIKDIYPELKIVAKQMERKFYAIGRIDRDVIYQTAHDLWIATDADRGKVQDAHHSLYSAIQDITTAWITGDGKFTKRLLRRLPMVESYAGLIGDEITRKAYRANPIQWLLSISAEIFWNDGNFGKKYSCWWNSFEESREVFIDNGGIALLWHKNYDAFNGIGRCWLAPVDYCGYPVIYLFNQYGNADGKTNYENSIRIEDTALILKSIIPQTKIVDGTFENTYNDEIPYINNHDGYFIAPDNFTDSRIDCEVEWETEDSYTCYNCGDRISQDDVCSVDGNDYCESCYHDLFTCCEHCGEEIYRDDALFYEYDAYCETCFNRYFTTCDNCGESIPNDDAINVNYSDYCENCANDLFSPCDNCGELIPHEDIIAGNDGNYYCEDCATEISNAEEPAEIPADSTPF